MVRSLEGRQRGETSLVSCGLIQPGSTVVSTASPHGDSPRHAAARLSPSARHNPNPYRDDDRRQHHRQDEGGAHCTSSHETRRWRRESRANSSLKPNSLVTAKLTGIFRRSGLGGAGGAPKLVFRSGLYRLIPYSPEQGSLSGLQGIRTSDQGVCRPYQGIRISEQFWMISRR